MLRVLRATIRNFLTIGNVPQTIDLSIEVLTLILGENLDIGGANSRNGVGKTALLQAISYGLFGKPLTRIRLDNLCNNVNNKAMLVTIDFESYGKTYRIERGRKPEVFNFYTDGVQLKKLNASQGESKHTQTEIERIIGMSHAMFRHIVALNTSTTPFLNEEAKVQREVIEELFGITQLSQRAETLKGLIDITKIETRDAEATVKANGDANARITQAIDRAKEEAATWQANQNRRLAELDAKFDRMQAIDFDHELSIFDQIEFWHQQQRELDGQRQQQAQQVALLGESRTRLRQEIERHNKEANFAETRQLTRLADEMAAYRVKADQDIKPQINRLRSEADRRRRDVAKKTVEIERLTVEQAEVQERLLRPDLHSCMTCGQGLAGTDHLATVLANLAGQEQRLKAAIAALQEDQAQAESEAQWSEREIAKVEAEAKQQREQWLAKIEAVQAEIEQTTDRLQATQAAWTETADGLRAMLETANLACQDAAAQQAALPVLDPMPVSAYRSRDAVWQMRQERDLLISQLDTERAKPNPLIVKIEGLQSTLIEIDYTDLNELVIRLKHEAFLLKLLTAKESFVRKKLIDQNLIYLNKRLNHFLDRLGLPHEVIFMPDLSVEISMLGHLFDFEQLSRGERNRVILAMAFSFRDVWQNLNTVMNALFVDECLDQGTDGAGVEAAVAILKDMASTGGKSIFLISHREELRDQIENVILVRKENNFTQFVEQRG